jgi:hypothetical protein
MFDVNGAPTCAHLANFVEIIGVTKQVDRFVMIRRNLINSACMGGKRGAKRLCQIARAPGFSNRATS